MEYYDVKMYIRGTQTVVHVPVVVTGGTQRGHKKTTKTTQVEINH